MDYATSFTRPAPEPHGKPRDVCAGGESCRSRLHLCRRFASFGAEALRPLVAEPRYYCRVCGRVAGQAALLCKPALL